MEVTGIGAVFFLICVIGSDCRFLISKGNIGDLETMSLNNTKTGKKMKGQKKNRSISFPLYLVSVNLRELN